MAKLLISAEWKPSVGNTTAANAMLSSFSLQHRYSLNCSLWGKWVLFHPFSHIGWRKSGDHG
jgi:hypothetical protein